MTLLVDNSGVIPESSPGMSAVSPHDIVSTISGVTVKVGTLVLDVSDSVSVSIEPSQLLIVISSSVGSGKEVSVVGEVVD